MDDQLVAAGVALQEASSRRDAARDVARQLARDAHAAGDSEYAIAQKLNVDRMTIRRWLGKR